MSLMRLIHLLADLPKNPNKWALTNVESISINGDDIVFNCGQEELEMVKSDLKDVQKSLKDEEGISKQLAEELEKAEKELVSLRETVASYKISPTDTIADLISRNEWQEERLTTYSTTLANYKNKFLDFEREIKELRARRNKATVKRCQITGKLIATLQDVEYEMIKK